MSRASSRTIYVGNLPGDVREREIEDLFYKYGRIIEIDLKLPPRPPGYCFIEFEDPRDAEDAIRGRDGYDFDGNKLRVELAHGGSRGGGGGHGDGYRGDRFNSGRVGGISRHSEFRVIVSNLPPSASWQDLKDHMRKAGDVCFAQVFKDGAGMAGIVDYNTAEDMKYAVKKLDDSEFRNPFARTYIREPFSSQEQALVFPQRVKVTFPLSVAVAVTKALAISVKEQKQESQQEPQQEP
eukprot:jgi/Chlat1/80/Chrsp1S00210